MGSHTDRHRHSGQAGTLTLHGSGRGHHVYCLWYAFGHTDRQFKVKVEALLLDNIAHLLCRVPLEIFKGEARKVAVRSVAIYSRCTSVFLHVIPRFSQANNPNDHAESVETEGSGAQFRIGKYSMSVGFASSMQQEHSLQPALCHACCCAE